ncbi:helix-turn-helix domain-containing protein [Yinghuangia seranimata]|uniref:helix-turn-helix domain-containing protein n=1 Tax=Yinghuangia seranimata TaxID=408067 RepID=UPI00248AA3E0|nr:helix-turn-helix transcriptional regulator [Yinghuangia seranimata]MDI2124887.1 helix-turn-helix transcriptional regulator [Yinghuangia seranimata]
MDRRTELGAFLRGRRAGIRPTDVGLPDGGRRRVPGLRREELAALAGISADYYARLEQGREANVSPRTLDDLARALRLDEDSHAQLYRLAASARPPGARGPARAPRRPVRQVRPGLRRVLDALDLAPALVIGRRLDVQAWNPLAAALLTDFGALPPARRNLASVVFRDPHMGCLYADWHRVAREVTARLRADAEQHPDDPTLAELVGELALHSEEFRTWWADPDVPAPTPYGVHALRHPVVGELTLAYEVFHPPGDLDQTVLVYTAEEDSPSADGLRLLEMVSGGAPARKR